MCSTKSSGSVLNEVEKWFSPGNDAQYQLFLKAHEELKFFLDHRGEGVDVDYVQELLERHSGMKIPFQEMGFITFRDFLFHCDEIFDVTTDGEAYYLFPIGYGSNKQVRARSEEGHCCSTVYTTVVSSDVLVKKSVEHWITGAIFDESLSSPEDSASESKSSTAVSLQSLKTPSMKTSTSPEISKFCCFPGPLKLATHLVGADAYGYLVLISSDSQTNETFETAMEKLGAFYSSSQHQAAYRMKSDDMVVGAFIVIQINQKYLRAKILDISTNMKICLCLGVDDFKEHVVSFEDMYHMRPKFCKIPARLVMCVIDGTQSKMFRNDVAVALQRVKELRGLDPEMEVTVLQEWHPTFHAPIVKLRTMDGINMLNLINCYCRERFSSSIDTELSDYQKSVLAELERRHYFFEP